MHGCLAPTQKVCDISEKLASLLVSPSIDSPLESEIAQEFQTVIKNGKKALEILLTKSKGK